MMRFFVTGTNTNVGKTYISIGLIHAFNQLGFTTIGCKLVSSGGNDDITLLQHAASIKLDDSLINPFSFEEPIAPHIAAMQSNIKLTVAQLSQKTNLIFSHPADIYLFEGAGGWYVPLNENETMADFVIAQNFNVILVIGIQLGCLNHAILTAKALQNDGATMIGWVANCIDPAMKYVSENVNILEKLLAIPYLGVVNYEGNVGQNLKIKKVLVR